MESFTEARGREDRRDAPFSNGYVRKCRKTESGPCQGSGACTHLPWVGWAGWRVSPPHCALAPLIRVQQKARERAVLVVVASVRLAAVQLHIHLVARVEVQHHAVAGVVVVLVGVLRYGAGPDLVRKQSRSNTPCAALGGPQVECPRAADWRCQPLVVRTRGDWERLEPA